MTFIHKIFIIQTSNNLEELSLYKLIKEALNFIEHEKVSKDCQNCRWNVQTFIFR